MKNKKSALERLEEFEPYRAHCRRKLFVEEFLGELKKTAARLPIPSNELTAVLITFMEWLDEKKKKPKAPESPSRDKEKP